MKLHAAVLVVSSALVTSLSWGQAVPPGFGPATVPQPQPGVQQPARPQQPPAQQPSAQQPNTPAQPNAATLAAEQQNIPTSLPQVSTGGLNLQNASLVEVINVLAQQLKINYILDPRVKGGVTVNTYGEVKSLDTRNLLDLILRINGAGMVQVSENLWRIVPLADILRMPGLQPEVDAKDIEATDAPMLNLIFLKFAQVEEVAKLLDPFIGEGARTIAYPPANLLLIQDSRRNMRRLMELIGLFDNEAFTGQRVRLFEVKEARPSDLAKELDSIFKGISLNEKQSPVKFLPIDRINTMVAVASNPGVFNTVEEWIKKLDIPVQITAGAIDNHVYRVKYGRAEMLAMAIMSLYGGYGMGMGMGMGGYGGFGMGMGGYGMGGMGMGGYGGMGMMGGYGMGGMGMGGYGGMGMMPGFTPQYQPNMGMGLAVGPGGAPTAQQTIVTPMSGGGGGGGGGGTAGAAGRTDQTGQYLQGGGMGMGFEGMPRVVPNPMDNSLLIQATPQAYAGILKLLKFLDVPPRQVLIEAQIYEVNLSGAFGAGVTAYLQRRGTSGQGSVSMPDRRPTGTLAGNVLDLSVGALVGQSRELLAFLQTTESTGRAKVVSAPSVIATDSIPASINVGSEVPTITGQALTGVQQGGSSLPYQSIQNRNAGVTLNILARVNPSGVVTMVINQEVSAPIPPAASAAIQSPSFSKRTVSTQITMQDGDTVAIGGIIDEQTIQSSGGIPGLHRIPIFGLIFGSKSWSKQRTEMIIFLKPRVIYDTVELVEASDELKSRLRRVSKYYRDQD